MMQQQMMQPQQQMTGAMPFTQVAPMQSGGFGKRPNAWAYPFTGMAHFLAHPGLWLYALCPLIVGVFATIFAIGLVIAKWEAQVDFVRPAFVTAFARLAPHRLVYSRSGPSAPAKPHGSLLLAPSRRCKECTQGFGGLRELNWQCSSSPSPRLPSLPSHS